MGGDHGCGVVIDGTIQALEKCQHIERVQIIGDKTKINHSLDRIRNIDPRLEIIHASFDSISDIPRLSIDLRFAGCINDTDSRWNNIWRGDDGL